MRTNEIKINNIKYNSVLLCGGKSFKIYSPNNLNGFILSIGKKPIHIDDKHSHFKLVANYANLKYQSISEIPEIKLRFDKLVSELAESGIKVA